MRNVCNYFDRKLMQWARRKYRNLKGGLVGSYRWLKAVADKMPNLFVSWRLFGIPTARYWEPYDARVSRTVLREAEGETPSAYLPTSQYNRPLHWPLLRYLH